MFLKALDSDLPNFLSHSWHGCCHKRSVTHLSYAPDRVSSVYQHFVWVSSSTRTP